MKRLVLFVAVVLTICISKSTAQTSIPFYGFELSNYEVGDTLEYSYSLIDLGPSEHKQILFEILDKEFVNISSIIYKVYTIRALEHHVKTSSGDTLLDTTYVNIIERQLSSDPIMNNNNNLLDVFLSVDTADFFQFDTINGLKHLDAGAGGIINHESLENLGVKWYWNGFGVENYELIYANLQHYGIYGTYEFIYLSDESISKQNALVVNYNSVLSSDVNDKEFYVGNLTTGIYFYNVTGNQTASGKILIH